MQVPQQGRGEKKKHNLSLRSLVLRVEHLLAYFNLKQHAASQHHLGHMFVVMFRLTCRLAMGLLTVWTVVDINIRSLVLIHSNTAVIKKNIFLNYLHRKWTDIQPLCNFNCSTDLHSYTSVSNKAPSMSVKDINL